VHRRVGRRRGGRSEAPRGAPPAGAGVRARRPGGGGEPGIGSRDAFWWPCAVVVAVVVVPGAVAACRGRGGGPVPSCPACPAGGDPVRAGPGAYAPGIRGADPPGPAAARGIPALRRTGRPVARRPPAGTLARFHRCRRDPGKAALHRLDAWRQLLDRKSTRLNSSHVKISYAVFCLKKNTFDHWYNGISLRTKITGGTVLLLTCGLAVAGMGTMTVLRTYLLGRRDATVTVWSQQVPGMDGRQIACCCVRYQPAALPVWSVDAPSALLCRVFFE